MIVSHRNQQGFTLVEISITLGIFAIIATFSLLASMDFWRSYSFRSERNLVVGILQKARSQSLSNINQIAHGVHIEPYQYVIFEGGVYTPGDPNNEIHQANPSVNHSGMTEVLFDQLSGNAHVTLGALILDQGSSQSIISINDEGQIDWTN
ncbi:MAG: prepilin-type N-terminal cleavage/methylation domain-containing protein [Patescibacteria group bacterium]